MNGGLLILLLSDVRACSERTTMHCRLELTHIHALYIYIIVYDRFIRVTLLNGAAADRMIDGPQLDGAAYIHIYMSFVRLSATITNPRITVVGPRAYTRICYIISFGNS